MNTKKDTDTPSEIRQILSFQLADHQMAFYVSEVSAILRVPEITAVARSADFFEGMINLRGQLTPVIDLRVLFGFPKIDVSPRTSLIAVKGNGFTLCVMVDAMPKLKKIDAEKLAPPPEIMFSRFIDTVYKMNEKLILILHAKKLVDPVEIKNIIDGKEKITLLKPESQQETV